MNRLYYRRQSRRAGLDGIVNAPGSATLKHRLAVKFDGTDGIVDVAELVEFTGVFEPLRDPELFAQATSILSWAAERRRF